MASIFRSQFKDGWKMILIAMGVPLIFSLTIELMLWSVKISNVASAIVLNQEMDFSYIINYLIFGLFHITLCMFVTMYVYDISKNTSSNHLYKEFKKNHLIAFLFVTVTFLSIIYFSDSALEILSCDLLWLGLKNISSNHSLFSCLENFTLKNTCDPGLRYFFLIPIILVISAFLPASAIMLSIPHMINKIDLKESIDNDYKETISKFLSEFEVVYFMMVALFISSIIATLFYLETPFVKINKNKSLLYTNYIDSAFIAWSIIYFVILFIVLFFSYSLVSKRIRNHSSKNDVLIKPSKYQDVRILINVHFLIRKKSTIFASSFSPILLQTLKQIFS